MHGANCFEVCIHKYVSAQKKTREKHMVISPGNGMSRFYVQQLHKSPKQ